MSSLAPTWITFGKTGMTWVAIKALTSHLRHGCQSAVLHGTNRRQMRESSSSTWSPLSAAHSWLGFHLPLPYRPLKQSFVPQVAIWGPCLVTWDHLCVSNQQYFSWIQVLTCLNSVSKAMQKGQSCTCCHTPCSIKHQPLRVKRPSAAIDKADNSKTCSSCSLLAFFGMVVVMTVLNLMLQEVWNFCRILLWVIELAQLVPEGSLSTSLMAQKCCLT